MSESGSVEDNRAGNFSEITLGEVPEIRTLTQEAVNQQIKRFIGPVTRQLEELSRLVQGMVTIPHPSHYPRTDYSTISGTAVQQPDSRVFVHCCTYNPVVAKHRVLDISTMHMQTL